MMGADGAGGWERFGEGAGAALVGCMSMGTIAKDMGVGEQKGSAGRLFFESNQERLGLPETGGVV